MIIINNRVKTGKQMYGKLVTAKFNDHKISIDNIFILIIT